MVSLLHLGHRELRGNHRAPQATAARSYSCVEDKLIATRHRGHSIPTGEDR